MKLETRGQAIEIPLAARLRIIWRIGTILEDLCRTTALAVGSSMCYGVRRGDDNHETLFFRNNAALVPGFLTIDRLRGCLVAALSIEPC